ncbi:hypothetical protein AXI76_gp201 [Pseudoalteromonas phage H101]|uniref:Uncharacterized protein n=1 Tax=Pseudoalteromonas phage H101 TaxID=1654919 RepID=A0A0H4IP30_9CAUD|nr:hypothetical protein AXI76_gp201 [Pseudoalteromonas phage H101]AKO61102.1 hypothetical protein [Pseudoalteromonas phage H101]|tara:strand:- start:1996 stop:3636 length:1641 start_codon:yes stop_codon:yes gene_type:complete
MGIIERKAKRTCKNSVKNCNKREFRFKTNFNRIGKKHKDFIKLDQDLLNKIRFNKPSLKGMHRGYDNINLLLWNDIGNLLDIYMNYDKGYNYNWYVDCSSLSYISDIIACKGSPDHPVLFKDMTDYELLGMFIDYQKDIGISRISRKKTKAVLDWFIHYFNKNRDKCINAISYSRDKSFNTKYNVDNKDLSYSVLIRFIDFMVDKGLAITLKGNKLYSCSVMSLLIINPEVERLIPNLSNNNTGENKVFSGSFVKVTDSDGKVIPLDEVSNKEYLIRTEEQTNGLLTQYHKIVDMNTPEINNYSLGDVRLHRVIKEKEDINCRWFDDGSFQGKPKNLRKSLTFKGCDTVSLDFKSLHPAILLYYKGVKLKDHNPYPSLDFITVNNRDLNKFKAYYNIDNYDPTRNLVKKLFLAMINASSVNMAVGSIYEDLYKDKLKKGTYKEHTMKYIGIGEVDLHKVAECILEHNSIISEYLGVGVGNELQYVDSMIIYYCIEELVKMHIPFIPVHDSISCKVEDKELVLSVMERSFVKAVGEGSECNCIIEEE